jgi:hypothetical protein
MLQLQVTNAIGIHLVGDLGFQASRRKISRSMSASGIKIFGYQFTDPNATVPPPVPVAPGSLGGTLCISNSEGRD